MGCSWSSAGPAHGTCPAHWLFMVVTAKLLGRAVRPGWSEYCSVRLGKCLRLSGTVSMPVPLGTHTWSPRCPHARRRNSNLTVDILSRQHKDRL